MCVDANVCLRTNVMFNTKKYQQARVREWNKVGCSAHAHNIDDRRINTIRAILHDWWRSQDVDHAGPRQSAEELEVVDGELTASDRPVIPVSTVVPNIILFCGN